MAFSRQEIFSKIMLSCVKLGDINLFLKKLIVMKSRIEIIPIFYVSTKGVVMVSLLAHLL